MSEKLFKLLGDSSHELVQDILARLRSSTAPHYEQMDASLLNERTVLLVGSFIMSTRNDPVPFVIYVREMAEDRISEGFFLHEIQRALTLLEEKVWQLVVEKTPPEEHVDHLRQVTATIGTAKDQLAQVYLRHKEQADARIALLKDQLAQLLKGTVSPPLTEDDGPDAA